MPTHVASGLTSGFHPDMTLGCRQRDIPRELPGIYARGASRPTESGIRPMQQIVDRTAEDLGNAIHVGHVNVTIPDQRLATLFYAAGLGLTRDPYLMSSDNNMWINVGRSQFHLPTD